MTPVAVPTDHVGSGMLILDPEDKRRGPFSVEPPHGALRTDFLGQGGDPVLRIRRLRFVPQCGEPCYVVGRRPNPSTGPTPAMRRPPALPRMKLFPVEGTYDEWLHSAYATAAGVVAPAFAGAKPDGIVRTCQDCHMPRTTGVAAEGGVVRDCVTTGCLPRHTLVGGNTWAPQLPLDPRRLNALDNAGDINRTIAVARTLLGKAATLSVTVALSGELPVATVRATNESGHKLPTGYSEGRRLWLSVQAFDAAGARIYLSGSTIRPPACWPKTGRGRSMKSNRASRRSWRWSLVWSPARASTSC